MESVPLKAQDIDALWDFTDPAQSERRFRQAAADDRADPAVVAEILTQVARALGLQQKYEEADGVLDGLTPLLPPGPSRLRARCLLERGRVLNSSGHPERARPLFLEALRVAELAGEDFYAIDAAHMVAIASSGDERLEWNRRGLAMAASSDDARSRGWKGSLYNNLGWTHHGRGELIEAQHCFDEALRARLEQGDIRRIRHARWCVARGLRSLGRVDEALRIQRELQSELEHAGETDSDVDEEIKACLAAFDRTGGAQTT